MRKSTMIEGAKLELVQGDLTSQNTDAVVNSANRRLAPGVGVTGEIHDAAGPELYEECKRLGKIDIGEAVVTNGYRLPVNHIIHTVAPIYSGYEKDEGELRKSFRNSLKVAVENGVKSVSFPAINTVAYRYPVEKAADIALDEIKRFLEENDDIDVVRIVLSGEEDFMIHAEKFEEILEPSDMIE